MKVNQLEEHAQGLPFVSYLDSKVFSDALNIVTASVEEAIERATRIRSSFDLASRRGRHYVLVEAERVLNEANGQRNERSRENCIAYTIVAAYHSDFLKTHKLELLTGGEVQAHRFRVEWFDTDYFGGRNAFLTPFRHAKELEPQFHALADMHFSRAHELRGYIRRTYETAPFRNARLAEVGHYLGRLHNKKHFFEESLEDMRAVDKYIRQWPRDLPKIVRAAKTLCMELSINGHEDYATELSALTAPWAGVALP